jgi:glutamate--cysteine ligase
MNIQDQIHEKICNQCDPATKWFTERSRSLAFPIYASFDVRDSGEKIGPVDANIFPAGFNNICPTDKDSAGEIVSRYMKQHHPSVKNVALLCEEHTGNVYYWENIRTLLKIFESAGLAVQAAIPRELSEPITVKTSSGSDVVVHFAENKNGDVWVGGVKADLVICNNDFSDGYSEWSRNLRTPFNPPYELGWYQRKKYTFFQQYNELAGGFAKVIGVDARLLQVATDVFSGFDANDEDSRKALASKVDSFLASLRQQYKAQGITSEPFCFLKNNSGTYGLAVMQAHSGAEILDWNNKIRKKMKAAKGGRDVTELIIQEGIPTKYREPDGGSAEPCIYTVGDELVGGFLRSHSERGPDESLNSPGAVYKRLCVSDLQVKIADCPMENVYGWISRLGVLAIALEARAGSIAFNGYKI